MIRRNWIIALACILLAPIAAFMYSKAQTPEYTASASLLFTSEGAEARILGVEPTGNNDPAREAATNLKLASLQALSVKTAKALPESGLSANQVSEKTAVAPEGESELLAVSATDTDPAFAARLANEFAEQFVSFSREIEAAKVRRAQKLAEAQLEGLTEEQRQEQTGQILERRIVELDTLATLQTGRAEIAQEATAPESPSSPKTKRNVALGLLVGILLAIAAIALREQLDRGIRDADELEDLYGAPVLGTIPVGKPAASGGSDPATAEAFRMLRANLRFLGGGAPSSVLLTSSVPQEGKTMVAWGLARAETGAEQHVLVIEADLRRPTLAEVAGTTSQTGLGLVLAAEEDAQHAIRTVKGVDLLVAGPTPPNPGELLESHRMSELLHWAESNYDRVIIDSPPASLVADSTPLFSKVGAVIAVGRLGKSTRDSVEQLHDHLVRLHAPLVGVVVNGAGRPTETSYYRPWQALRHENGAGSRARSSTNGRHRGTARRSTRS